MVLERFRNVENLARVVGLYMVGKTQSAFSQQGRGGIAWRPRAVPNRIGILHDLYAGRMPPSRRFEDRPAGIDTGRLRSSIASRVQGNTVIVGSNVPYASDVQKGSKSSIQIDGSLRRSLSDWLRSLSGDRKQQASRALGPLFRTGQLTSDVPPRPFLMLTDEDRRTITDMARKFFQGGAQ